MCNYATFSLTKITKTYKFLGCNWLVKCCRKLQKGVIEKKLINDVITRKFE